MLYHKYLVCFLIFHFFFHRCLNFSKNLLISFWNLKKFLLGSFHWFVNNQLVPYKMNITFFQINFHLIISRILIFLNHLIITIFHEDLMRHLLLIPYGCFVSNLLRLKYFKIIPLMFLKNKISFLQNVQLY